MACSAHRFHVPAQPASDSHHVIPQAWQRAFRPEIAPRLDRIANPAPYILWDRRTVELCPNCHRGVHERIVKLMHGKPKGRDRLSAIAQQALDRFTLVGGNLDALRAAHLYGEQ